MFTNAPIKNQHSNDFIFLEGKAMKQARIDHLKPTSVVYCLDLLHSITVILPLKFICIRKTNFFSLFVCQVRLGVHPRNTRSY